MAALRASLSVSVESACPAPVRSFDEAGFPPAVRAACAGFAQPSPIQAQAWPVLLSGRDLVGIAATGSGKARVALEHGPRVRLTTPTSPRRLQTLAFLLPGFVHIAAQPRSGAGEPVALVLAPTRELAMQTAEVAAATGAACGVRSVCVYGGAPKGPQQAALRGGASLVVATPGRLQDLHDRRVLVLVLPPPPRESALTCARSGAVSFARISYLVLDEADRMLDLGFEPAIRAIAGAVRSDRHTLMFSATWPVSVRALAAEFMCAPAMVRVGAEGTRAAQSITQVVEVLESEARDGRLEQVLLQHLGSKQSPRRCLVFVLYKKEATRVNDWLRRRGWRCCEIQGDMPQKARTDAVAAFKSGATPMLVATDVAARGLDIPGVELVLNYSFPLTIEDYVHRVGRTGRAGATGCAHTFFCNQDKCAPKGGPPRHVPAPPRRPAHDEPAERGSRGGTPLADSPASHASSLL